MTTRNLRVRTVWTGLFLVLAWTLIAQPGYADNMETQPTVADEAPVNTTDESLLENSLEDSEDYDRVVEAMRHLGQAAYLGVNVVSNYNSMQDNGEMIEFGEKRRIDIQRPDKAYVDVDRTDGTKTLLWYNGKTLTAYKPGGAVYAVADAPATVDEMIDFLTKKLNINFPIAQMFMTTIADDIEDTLDEISFVTTNNVLGETTDHFALRGENTDVQLWLTTNDPPLPLRIVVNYKLDPDRPQFQADFSSWTFEKPSTPVAFEFTPPDGIEKVPFTIEKDEDQEDDKADDKADE